MNDFAERWLIQFLKKKSLEGGIHFADKFLLRQPANRPLILAGTHTFFKIRECGTHLAGDVRLPGLNLKGRVEERPCLW